MIIALVVIASLAVLILGHEAGHFFVAKAFKMKIEEFGIGFPPRITARKKGETEYSINWLPFGGFVRIAGENDRLNGDPEAFDTLPADEKAKLFYFRPAWQRSAVLLAGVFMNIVIGWILISAIFMIGTPHSVIVAEVQENSPAASVGLQRGDIIQGFATAQDFTAFTRANLGKEVDITVLRDSGEKTIHVALRSEVQPDQGALGVSMAEVGVDRENPLRALWSGMQTTWEMLKGTVLGFFDLLKNIVTRGKIPEGVVGPIGIFGVAQSVGSAGWAPLLQLIALISVNLAVLNLIPFPALDGGRFLFIIIEKLKGSPISKTVEANVNGLSFLFLIALMLLVTARDIIHLF